MSVLAAFSCQSGDDVVQGSLLVYLVDLAQVVLDHDVDAERRSWGRAMLDCMDRHLDRVSPGGGEARLEAEAKLLEAEVKTR